MLNVKWFHCFIASLFHCFIAPSVRGVLNETKANFRVKLLRAQGGVLNKPKPGVEMERQINICAS